MATQQYYPYVTFSDGTKMEFDALLVATGVVQKLPTIEGITTDASLDLSINLPENVFCPLRSKEQHLKLHYFLNTNSITRLLVFGYNIESLEFIHALNHEFPDIKVTVIDSRKESAIGEFLGPELEKNLSKEFSSRGVDFFVKIRDELFFSNKFSSKNAKKRALEAGKTASGEGRDERKKYQDAVTVRISDDLRVKADGVIIFPHEFAGNTVPFP